MGHAIQGFVAKEETLQKLSARWGMVTHPLAQDFQILFFTQHLQDMLWDEWTSAQQKQDAFPDNFQLLNQGVLPILEEVTQDGGQLAYIETDYFGGKGTQSALLYTNGKLEIPPQRTDSYDDFVPFPDRAINQILKVMGAEKGDAIDEFEALRLTQWRHNPQILSD